MKKGPVFLTHSVVYYVSGVSGVEASDDAAATYELDHLATFGVTSQHGGAPVKPTDGLDRLNEMDTTIGVWAMKVFLHIDRRQMIVKDQATHKVHNANMIDDDDDSSDNNIIIISKTIFMVLSSWQSHCESSPGSFDECRTAPSGRRPKTKSDDRL